MRRTVIIVVVAAVLVAATALLVAREQTPGPSKVASVPMTIGGSEASVPSGREVRLPVSSYTVVRSTGTAKISLVSKTPDSVIVRATGNGTLWIAGTGNSNRLVALTVGNRIPTGTPVINPGGPIITPSPSGGLVITSADSGKTETVSVGTVITIGSQGLLLTINGDSAPTVLEADDTGTAVRYLAAAPGTAVLTGTGRPNCQADTACPQFIMLFRTTIIVK